MITKGPPLRALAARAFAPVDAASLACFRLAFGAVMTWEVVRYFSHGWIAADYIQPAFHFKYFGFDWVRPWPGSGMYGGLAKLNHDWLRGEPMRMWLAESTHLPLLGRFFTEEWIVLVFAYGGLLLDLLIVPFLIWSRSAGRRDWTHRLRPRRDGDGRSSRRRPRTWPSRRSSRSGTMSIQAM